jgi:hypothetical protein
MPSAIDDDTLQGYLSETLPPEEMARVEKALRSSATLRDRLEDVRQNRGDAGLHSLGAIWRRHRLTCPSRQELGSFLLEALDPDRASYIMFHLEVIECTICLANLTDLKGKAAQASAATKSRQHRIYHSSRHLLGDST